MTRFAKMNLGVVFGVGVGVGIGVVAAADGINTNAIVKNKHRSFLQQRFKPHRRSIPDQALVSRSVQVAPPPDLSTYGYNYTQDHSNGGFLHIPTVYDDASTLNFSEADGVTTVEECASRCQEYNAPSGGWASKYESCWCYFVEVGICKEPCVVDEGMDFSRTPFDSLDYCAESLCQDEIYHDYCNFDIVWNEMECDATIAERSGETGGGGTGVPVPTPPPSVGGFSFPFPTPPPTGGIVNPPTPTSTSETVDFSAYGFPYSQDASDGFLTFPREADPQGLNVMYFDASDNVTSAESCAMKCSTMATTAGAWNSRDDACWCYFVDVEMYCKEPCIEEEGVEFSTFPLIDLEYCSKSFCDEENFFEQVYCVDMMGFNVNDCNTKIANLTEDIVSSGTVPTSPSSENGEPEDFSAFGYNYSMPSEDGYLTWPPELDDSSTLEFNSTDGVTNVQDCAAKCQESAAPSGAWNPKYGICWCYFIQSGLCKEPCIEESGVEFSTFPMSELGYCEKSICDKDWYYNDGYQEYCDVDANFDAALCDAKIASLNEENVSPSVDSLPDLTLYGYPFSMSSAEGFQTYPPGYGDDFVYFNATDGVTDSFSCADKCKELDAQSGAWNPRLGSCWCYFSRLGICREPCLEDEGVEFSRTPLSALSYCEKSICDEEWFYNDYQEYCDEDMKFDAAACDAKMASRDDGTSSTSTSSTLPATENEGIAINECADTLKLFGDDERSQAFIDVITCSCEGDLSSAYTMACKTENYCFDRIEGRVCVDINFTYDLEIDETSGLLLDSGFVNRSACTTFLSGNGPGTGDSIQCKFSNPQCERILMYEHSLFSYQAATVCSNQELCPSTFVELGYDDATAVSFCPTTYLDDVKCLTGADQICGFGYPGNFPQFMMDEMMHIATADCTNVAPCAAPTCNEVELFDPENPTAIRNGPVYPQCLVVPDEKSSSAEDNEVLDLFVSEAFAKFNSGSNSDSESTCGGICDSDPDSGCITRGRAFYIAEHCYPRNSLSGSMMGSRKYRIEGTMLCYDRFEDQHCQALSEIQDECTEIAIMETCDVNGERWKMMPGQCIRSDTPVDDFVVPLIERLAFNSDEDCAASPTGDALQFILQHSPDAPGLCQAARYPQKDLSLPQLAGSVRAYCEKETGNYANEFYTNGNCTEQDDNMYRPIASIGSCGAPPYPELGLPDYVRYDVNGCSEDEKPQYYCKDFVAAGFGSAVDLPPSAPTAVAVADDSTDETSGTDEAGNGGDAGEAGGTGDEDDTDKTSAVEGGGNETGSSDPADGVGEDELQFGETPIASGSSRSIIGSLAFFTSLFALVTLFHE